MENLLNIESAAKALGISEKTLYRWAGKTIPVVSLSKKAIRFRPQDIEAFIDGNLRMEETNLKQRSRKFRINPARRNRGSWEK